jgi:hypothetical protein
LPPEQPPPVREARLHLSLDFLKVSGGDGPEPFEPGQLRLERSPPLLAGLDAVQERLEVAPLGHRCREPTELLLQDRELRLEARPVRDQGVCGGVQLADDQSHCAPDDLGVQNVLLDGLQNGLVR